MNATGSLRPAARPGIIAAMFRHSAPITPLSAALFALAVLFGPARAQACETALVLAVDVSGSIDRGEYRLQQQGIARALSDGAVADALVTGQVALTVVHWSGAGQQAVVLPWRRMLSRAEVSRYAAAAAEAPRAFDGSDTAPGDLIAFAAGLFEAVADCGRKVVDISGDGPQNAGGSTAQASAAAHRAGIVVNGLAIEDMGASSPTTQYYSRHVVTPGGFVMTARGLGDYEPTLRAKILRELARPTG